MEIKIKTKEITLVQFLKFNGEIQTGGMFKDFIKNNIVLINNKKILTKRQKLKNNDKITINSNIFVIKTIL